MRCFEQISDERYDNKLATNEMIGQVAAFPDAIKNIVYGKLYEEHRLAGELPQAIPWDYGRLAFANQEGCSTTNEERAEAIRKAMAHFEI